MSKIQLEVIARVMNAIPQVTKKMAPDELVYIRERIFMGRSKNSAMQVAKMSEIRANGTESRFLNNVGNEINT